MTPRGCTRAGRTACLKVTTGVAAALVVAACVGVLGLVLLAHTVERKITASEEWDRD